MTAPDPREAAERLADDMDAALDNIRDDAQARSIGITLMAEAIRQHSEAAVREALEKELRWLQGMIVASYTIKGLDEAIRRRLASLAPAGTPTVEQDPRPTECPKCGSQLVWFPASPLAWSCINYGCGAAGEVAPAGREGKP